MSSGSKAKTVRDQSRSGTSIEAGLSFEKYFAGTAEGVLFVSSTWLGRSPSLRSLALLGRGSPCRQVGASYEDPFRLPSQSSSRLPIIFAPVGAHFELVAHFSHELHARERAERSSASR